MCADDGTPSEYTTGYNADTQKDDVFIKPANI